MTRPVALIVLDGWGLAPAGPGNAVALAETPCVDRLWQTRPRTTLQTSGRAVGLPEGQMGNSEVGHLNLGAGRTVWQDISRIDNAIADGSFFAVEPLRDALSASRCHLMGLVSDGGVHSSDRHVAALLRLARELGRTGADVLVHAFTDGRDTPPTSGRQHLERLLAVAAREGVGRLATVVGRYHAMDRDRRWERIARAFGALVRGEGVLTSDPLAAVEAQYAGGTTDEFLAPIVVEGTPRIGPGDAVVFFNFRADRARQLVTALGAAECSGFDRGPFAPVRMTTLTRYEAGFPYAVAFPPVDVVDTLGDVVASAGLPQLRMAETEKYAHVTYFFSGGREAELAGEERVLVPSPKVATYDLQPEMSAAALTDAAVARLDAGFGGLLVLNYANPDMVGHTGSLEAAIAACAAVDGQLARLLEALERAGGRAIVTADHGNAEVMVAGDGGPHTFHTTNAVPCVLVGDDRPLRDGGALSAVAPTLLALLGLEPPAVMGEGLL